MNEITSTEYWTEINELAEQIVAEAMEQSDNDRDQAEIARIIDAMWFDNLHETIDGHQWVIYYYYNDFVIKYSDNDEAYRDVYDNESIGQIVAEQGLDSLKTVIAYFAMYQDVSELISGKLDEFEAELEN